MSTLDQQDFIGYSRATAFLLVLWNLPSFDFPLDKRLTETISRLQPRFEDFLRLIGLMALIRAEDAEDDLLSCLNELKPEQLNYYDRQTVDQLLSLYRGTRRVEKLDYQDRSHLLRQTTPLFCRVLKLAIYSALWLRAWDYLEKKPSESHKLRHRIHDVLCSAFDLAPNDARGFLPDIDQFGTQIIEEWRDSPDVVRGLESEGKEALLKVISDLEVQ